MPSLSELGPVPLGRSLLMLPDGARQGDPFTRWIDRLELSGNTSIATGTRRELSSAHQSDTYCTRRSDTRVPLPLRIAAFSTLEQQAALLSSAAGLIRDSQTASLKALFASGQSLGSRQQIIDS